MGQKLLDYKLLQCMVHLTALQRALRLEDPVNEGLIPNNRFRNLPSSGGSRFLALVFTKYRLALPCTLG